MTGRHNYPSSITGSVSKLPSVAKWLALRTGSEVVRMFSPGLELVLAGRPCAQWLEGEDMSGLLMSRVLTEPVQLILLLQCQAN